MNNLIGTQTIDVVTMSKLIRVLAAGIDSNFDKIDALRASSDGESYQIEEILADNEAAFDFIETVRLAAKNALTRL